MFMNECIDSTIGQQCAASTYSLLCYLLVTIRGLVGPSKVPHLDERRKRWWSCCKGLTKWSSCTEMVTRRDWRQFYFLFIYCDTSETITVDSATLLLGILTVRSISRLFVRQTRCTALTCSASDTMTPTYVTLRQHLPVWSLCLV
jgi:hypothetical protein